MTLTIEIPEEIEPDVREFFERARTGQLELHVVHGRVVGADLHSLKRVKIKP